MSKKILLLTAILLTAMFAACQPNPTPISSTQHAPDSQKSTANHTSTNHNGNHSGTNHETMNHNSANHSNTNSASHTNSQH